ncbi:hypothetical protein Taro_035843 [Colocasia esculenta]|uniref:Uncharacterized protein n=1 Tax=Colocasia esculenta TaxID=4460 RepID=A0A843W005_COLES|nr:hypothetical protein [Colocasia esculenta]
MKNHERKICSMENYETKGLLFVIDETSYKKSFMVYAYSSSSEDSKEKPDGSDDEMASSWAPESVQLTPDQLQRLAKIPICLGKAVEFSHLTRSLSWVEETLSAMGWTKLCQISEPSVEFAIRAFYASLQVSSENAVIGYVKGTKNTISEELLVKMLDCPNSGHKLSEFVPLGKQKLGIIGNLLTISKRGLQVNELSAEKRLIHSVITNIVTPRAGTHSSITARDGNLLFWAIQRHQSFSVDLSGELLIGKKEKISIFTLRRSHYSLVGKKQNLWFKDTVPECEHEVFPDEPLISLPTQVVSERIEAPEVLARSEAQAQIPHQEDQIQDFSSHPVQDTSEDTINEVLRDLRGKGVASKDVHASTPMEHHFEERETHFSPSQFETRPRFQGESSNSINTILDLVRSQHENLSVLHMQVELLDVKFDSLSDELVCQQGTSRPSGPASSQQQEEEAPAQDQENQVEPQVPTPEDLVIKQSVVVQEGPEIQAEQQPISVESQQGRKMSSLLSSRLS